MEICESARFVWHVSESLKFFSPPGSPAPDPEAVRVARRAEARQNMEAMLQDMRRKAQGLPEEKRKKYAADLKTLEDDQESISKVLSELGADLDSIPRDDRDAVKKQLRDEAWQPTKDAIGVRAPVLRLKSCAWCSTSEDCEMQVSLGQISNVQ